MGVKYLYGIDVTGQSTFSTNVGIGTLSPNANLDIAGGVVILGQNKIDGSSDNLKIMSDFANISGSSTIEFSVDNSEKMRITNTGNVGIGTTAPAAKLDVEGDINIINANLSNQENLDVDTGTEVIAIAPIALYTAAFFDFVVKNGANVRSGTVYACHDGTSVEYTETSTADLGNTSAVVFTVDISSGNMRLLATTTTDNWSVKTLTRTI